MNFHELRPLASKRGRAGHAEVFGVRRGFRRRQDNTRHDGAATVGALGVGRQGRPRLRIPTDYPKAPGSEIRGFPDQPTQLLNVGAGSERRRLRDDLVVSRDGVSRCCPAGSFCCAIYLTFLVLSGAQRYPR
jgi:hypothetical protein